MTSETPAVCPQCALPIPAPRPALCPRCRYPLLLIEQHPHLEDEARDLQRPTPEQPADHTMIAPPPAVLPEGAAAAAPPPGQQLVTCPQCGLANQPDRVWCERCGIDLTGTVTPPAPAPPPEAPEPPPPRKKSVWSWLWFPVALVLAIALGVGGTYWILQPRVEPSPSPSASPSESPQAPATPVAADDIKIKASSTLKRPDNKYSPRKTLDGDPTTAWNSDGDAIGPEAKVTLRWTFSSPIRVARIELYNGYQRDEARFFANSRLGRVRIITEDGDKVVDLADRMGSQEIALDSGPTSFVEFRVQSVYRDDTTKYNDLALSEIQFFGREP